MSIFSSADISEISLLTKKYNMENFEIAMEGEYKDELIRRVEKTLEKKLPDYVRGKVLIIKLVDME